MDVLRHDDVTYKGEAVAVAYLAQNLDENISGANRAQQRQTPVTSTRNKMQMTAAVVAHEFVGHGTKEKSKPRPSKSGRVGHPERPNQSLSGDLP